MPEAHEPARFADGRPQNLAAAALSAVELIEAITARVELPEDWKRLCFQRVRDITYHLTPAISPPKFAEGDSTGKRQAKPWQDLGGEG